MCGVLNYGGSYRFAHLSGVFPFYSTLDADRDLARRFYDFSLSPEGGKKSEEDSVCPLARLHQSPRTMLTRVCTAECPSRVCQDLRG